MANRLNVQKIYASDSDTTAALTISSTDGISAPGLVGMIAAFAMSTVPSGWLVCNGAEYESGVYSDLYTAITSTWVTAWTNGESITTGDFRKNASGTIYIATSTGTTSGTDVGDDVGVTWSTTTKFLVPDLRGEFLRGFDNGIGNDPDSASRTGGDSVGSSQDSANKRHAHTVDYDDISGYWRYSAPNGTFGAGDSCVALAAWLHNGSYTTGQPSRTDTGSPSAYETRPRNKYVQYCIKY